MNSSCVINAKNNTSDYNVVLPAATISGTTTVCQNATQPQITFTGSGGTAPYTFTYDIDGGNTLKATTIGNNTTITIPVSTAIAATFNYNLISVHDSANPTQEQPSSGIATVTVNPPPIVDFTFTNDNTCSGTTIQFSAFVTGTGTYAWDFGNGNTSTLQNPSHVFTELGCGTSIITVKLTVTNGSCTVSKTKSINIKQIPDINFSDVNNPFAPEPFNNCQNASASNSSFLINVKNSSASTNCVTSYTVNWGDGMTQSSVTFPISHNYTLLGVYDMVITATGSNGCSNSKSYKIKNVSNPLGGLNSPGSTQNLCAPTSNLQFSISNWGTNSLDTTYKVNYGDGTPVIILTQNQLNSSSNFDSANPSNSSNYLISHVFTTSSCPLTSFIVKLDVTNACGTTPFTLGNISILTKPTANFTAPVNACINNSVLFTNTTISGFGQNCIQGSIYNWDFGDGSPIVTTQISSPQNINHTYTSSGTFTVTLTAQNGCGTTSKIQTICIEPPLLPSFTLNNNSGCTSQAITATNSTIATNSCTLPTYIWSTTFNPSSCGSVITSIPNQTTTNASFNFIEAGTYTIKLTATNSCGSVSISQTVTVKKPPSVTINAISNFCGPTNINPTTTVINCGTQALTYAWSFPGGLPATSSLAVPGAISYTLAGNYTVSLIVTNECGATTTATKTFNINASPILTNTPLTQTICSGSTTALVSLTSNTLGTTFSWTAIATSGITGFTASGTSTIPSQTISTTNTSSGTVTYAIIPTVGGCPGTATNYVLTVNPAPAITSQPASSTVCLGGTTNVLSLTISGASGTPLYQWYSNSANNTTTGTAIFGETNTMYTPPSTTSGTLYYYCVITLPTGGCSNIKTNTAKVTILPSATITTPPTPTQNLCVGSTILNPLTITYSGGTGTPTYQWYSNTTNSNTSGTLIIGATNASYTPPLFTNTGNYYYYVSVSFTGNGCLPVTSTVAEIMVFANPTISSQPIITQTLCQNATPLNLEVIATGGNGTFIYKWYSNLTNSNTGGTVIAGATTSTYTPPTNLVNTKYYYCILSQTTLGCSVTSTTAAISVITAPTISSQPASFTICQGGTPSVLSFVVTGAVGTPTYQWYSNSLNNTTSGTAIVAETNATFTPPSTTSGILYYYCIINLPSGGCSNIKTNTATVTIMPNTTFTTQPTPTQNLCIGATILNPLTITYSGGTGTPSYQWYSNSTNSNTSGTLIVGATASSFSPASITIPGNYYYYTILTLAGNGCLPVTSNVAEIMVYAAPTISTQPIIAQTLCQNSTPLNLEVIETSGNGTFTYKWYSNSNNSNTGGTLIAGATNSIYTPPTNLANTKYYYCVLSQATLGCSVTSATAAITVIIAPTISSQPLPSTVCLGGSPTPLSVTINGASGPPQYQWYSNIINTTTSGNMILGATNSTYTPSPSALGTTYYYCVITLASGGCSSLTSNIASVTINPTPTISNKNAIICSGNSFTITPDTISGDSVPLGTTYTWFNPNISPLGAISGASAQSTPQTSISQTLINTTTSPATVTYTVTPLSGVCLGINFTVIITVNPGISSNSTINNSTCFGANNGTIQTNITGGIPFTSGSPYLISWVGPNGFTTSSSSISNLAPGSYDLSIADAGGCPISKTYSITEPNDIVITTDVKKDITCFNAANGEIKITISGGTGNYTYVWTKNGIPYSTTEDLTNLSPGTYLVSVTDAKNCGPKTVSFTIIEPPILSLNLVSKTDVMCYGQSTGAINVNVAGGTLPYSYSWSGPNGYTSTNNNLTNVFTGTYNLIVTDNSGCSKTLSITLAQPTEIIINATTTPITCYGDNNASIKIVITGGLAPYSIVWSNLGSGSFQGNLSSGDYLITVTDALNCTKTLNVNIPEVPIFAVNPVVKNISCYGDKNGSINLNFVGGITPITLVWSDSKVAGTVRNNLGPGSYTVTITDSKPCTITRTFIILEPQLAVLSATITNALDCDNANSGAINLIVSGGTPPFSYTWSNGATTKDLINIPAGNYLVTVKDANGCSKQGQYSINRPLPIVTSVTTKTDINCDTKTVKQTFVAQVSGGVPPYQLVWSSGTVSGLNNELMNTNQNGTVLLKATDAIGCKSNYSFNVKLQSLGTPTFNSSSFANSNYGTYSINDPIQFTNTATGDFMSMRWDFGDGSVSTELNPVHTFINPKEYVVTQTVMYPFGCIYVHKITFNVKKGYVLVVPNAFTPNNDILNDSFRPVTKALKKVRLDIYDTLGSMIYSEIGDVLRGWDGTIKGVKAENGNYYCKVSAETFYGTIVNENHPFVLIK